MDVYDRIETLLAQQGITAYKLSKETGISTALLSQWKTRLQQPSLEKLQIIADYFNVSLDYLTGKSELNFGESENGVSYNNFEKLLKERGVTPYQVHKATGVAQSSLSDWKNGKSKPKYEKMKKIADYFGVTVDYLIGAEPEEQEQEIKSPLQANLIAIRKGKNITQEEMAKFLNVTCQTYSAYERGISVPDSLTLIKIARYFGVSVDRLVADSSQNDPNAPTVVFMDGGNGPVVHQKPEDKKETEREKTLNALLKATDKLSDSQLLSVLTVVENMNPEK